MRVQKDLLIWLKSSKARLGWAMKRCLDRKSSFGSNGRHWLTFGDRNTKFFHTVTTIHRRRNTYEKIQNEGIWIIELEHLEGLVTDYFRLFWFNLIKLCYTCAINEFPILTHHDLLIFNAKVTVGYRKVWSVNNKKNTANIFVDCGRPFLLIHKQITLYKKRLKYIKNRY